MNGISVIICCYNSALRLPQTIRHLMLQKILSNFSFEVIIVDNVSTDDTFAIALSELEKYNAANITSRVVSEPTPGLSSARLKGISEAKYELLVFCDDDNWLHEAYLETAYAIMNEDKAIGILGGRSIAVADVDLPYWLPSYQDCYAVGVQSLFSGDISARRLVWGAGMVFRKPVFDALLAAGFQNLLSDRTGNTLSSGGDSEICRWFIIAGYKLWYDERLLFSHFITDRRLTKQYIQTLLGTFERDDVFVKYYDHYLNSISTKKSSVYNCVKLILNTFKWILTRKTQYKLYIASVLPMSISKKIDPNYYKIRKAAANYASLYGTSVPIKS